MAGGSAANDVTPTLTLPLRGRDWSGPPISRGPLLGDNGGAGFPQCGIMPSLPSGMVKRNFPMAQFSG